MRRALIAAILLAGGSATADEPEDPKAAIAERGIVLKAGKRNFFVIVPQATPAPGTPTGSVLYKARVFFGDAKSLIELPGGTSHQSSGGESRDLGQDPRWINLSHLRRNGETYSLECSTTYGPQGDEKRTVALALADKNAIAKSVIEDAPRLHLGYILAREPGSTTYIYVDQLGSDKRIFRGKRGALKKLAIKEVADDSTALVIVTAKGTLTVTKASKKGDTAKATFGRANKAAPLDVLPIDLNRKLIYRELGVYTRAKTGQPCDEL